MLPMTTYETPGGLLVTDRRHQRASEVPQIDPREHVSNGNDPSTVGPESSAGMNVMYPNGGWHSEAWSGWPTDWATPWYGPDWSGTGYGRQNTALFGKVSTVMNCVDLCGGQLASFPVYGVDKNGTPFELPAWSLAPEPAMYASWGEMMHAAVNSFLLRGEVITYATGRFGSANDGAVSRFVVLSPDMVDIEWLDGRKVFSLGGEELNPADICHVQYQSWPGRVRGVSPLEWASRSVITASALEQYATNLATRGGIPWAVLKVRANINKTQAEDIQNRWTSAALRRDGAPAVMGGDAELVPLTLTPREMALLELREFDDRRICASFRTPAFLVNVETNNSMTYANSTDLRLSYWQSMLRPTAQLLADAWSSWLLPRGSRMEFNPDRYLQPGLAERAQAWSVMHAIQDPVTGERAITVEEIRAAERLIPQPNLSAAQRLTGGAT